MSDYLAMIEIIGRVAKDGTPMECPGTVCEYGSTREAAAKHLMERLTTKREIPVNGAKIHIRRLSPFDTPGSMINAPIGA